MNAAEVLKRYQEVCEYAPDFNLSKLEATPYHLNVAKPMQISVQDQGALVRVLSAFGATSGWLDYQSGKQAFASMPSPLVLQADYGYVMHAELSKDGASLHMRYNGAGHCVLTEYRYHPDEQGAYIVDPVTQQASMEELDKLHYLRFWELKNGVLGVNPVHACFTGFGG